MDFEPVLSNVVQSLLETSEKTCLTLWSLLLLLMGWDISKHTSGIIWDEYIYRTVWDISKHTSGIIWGRIHIQDWHSKGYRQTSSIRWHQAVTWTNAAIMPNKVNSVKFELKTAKLFIQGNMVAQWLPFCYSLNVFNQIRDGKQHIVFIGIYRFI